MINANAMKVLICTTPRELAYSTAQIPEPRKGEALLRIRRIGICGTDLHAFEGTQPFFSYPRILGHELAGEIAEGSDAPGFLIGEMVTFIPYFSCGHCIACRNGKTNCCANLVVCGVHSDGGMAEYLSVPSSTLVHGINLSPEALALVEPLSIGAHGIERASVRPGEYVLVVGAGPIGLGAMEFARIAGARVIAMDVNDQRLTFCKEKLKVDYAINARESNVDEFLKDVTRGDMPTVVVDATGNVNAINHSFKYMAHGARYILIGLQKNDITFSHPEFHKREGTLMSSRNATRRDFENVIAAMTNGLVDPTLYITHRVPFEAVGSEFHTWLQPTSGVIKAMVALD
jgi:2-desacetyl-2-hydroxyethyl bacteriochlorophyllide A dehydrogenase